MKRYISELGVYIIGAELIKEENLQKLYKVIKQFKNKYNYKIGRIIFLKTNKFIKFGKNNNFLAFTTFPYDNLLKTKVSFVNGADIYFNSDEFNELVLKRELKLFINPTSYVEFLVWHELGHVVDYYESLKKYLSGKYIIKSNLFQKLTKELPFSWHLIDDVITEAGGIDIEIFKKQIGSFPDTQSPYNEYFAESFALYNMNIYTPLSYLIIETFLKN